jgi:pimeloyl-ACP methyl ester carboxylesterase
VQNPQEKANIIARNAIRLLMMGWQNEWRELVSSSVLKAVFLKRDRAFTQGMRLAFQQGFQHVFEQLKALNLNPDINILEFKQIQIYLSNCLALLPYGDINPYESISIPQWINGSWQMVAYSVHPIELTPTSGFTSLFIRDQDRVFAYGLEPIHNPDAEPHLIFMGTTYPAGQGFWFQIKTDLEAFETAGKQLYRASHHKIAQWLDKQTKKPHVCGISLGGALSLLLALHQGDKLASVITLNPPGLYRSLKRSRFDRWAQLEKKPPVIVQKNANDPISLFGYWKTDWNVINVNPPEDKKGPSKIAAHAMNYAGLEGTQFSGVDVHQDNRARRIRNFLLYTLLRSLVYYSLIVPVFYVVRPAYHFVTKNYVQIALIIALSLSIAALALTPASPLAIGLIVALAIVQIPSVKQFVHNLKGNIKSLFGWNTPEPAICHSPHLPRNNEMDMYSAANKQEASFTYKELGEYYHAKRCTLKNKNFIPEDNNHNSNVEFKGLSKKNVLEQSSNTENQDKSVTIVATQGKINDIKQTLFYLRQSNDKVVKNLQQQERAYRRGKMRI